MNKLSDDRITIRRVEKKETELLQLFARQTFCDAFAKYNTQENIDFYLNNSLSYDTLYRSLCDPWVDFYFLFVNDELGGYIKLNQAPAQVDVKDPLSLEIERIYILHKFQNKQLGQVLINRAVERAKELEKSYIWLGVWDQNLAAMRFYERLGFRKTGHHAFFLGDEEQVDYIMKKEL